MIRIKSVSHKKIKIKGYKKSNLYRIIKQKYYKILQYQYISRKLKKRNFRSKWIKTINFILKENYLKYNLFIHSIKKQKIVLDRKIIYYFIVIDKANI